jgi:redox-sensitive bicupin YhaK (pirin superfamily)
VSVERIIAPRARRIAGASGEVDRVLPYRERRMVGPFIFADLMGPDDLGPGEGADVPPHPHVGLATVTYLFEGALLHRDSTGAVQRIEPGGVNWMTAGHGVAHSERTPPDVRPAAGRLAGLQTWVALPDEAEDGAPGFEHAGAGDVPAFEDAGLAGRLLVGTGFGVASPVVGASPLFHADVRLDAGARLPLPVEHAERAVLVIAGDVTLDGEAVPERHLGVAGPGEAVVAAAGPARVMTFGGAPVGTRLIWWNFVASTKDRIERAKADWAAHRFAEIPEEHGRVELPAAGG